MNKTLKELHVVAFDVPYPANYGGVIDIFYKVQALSEAGVKVHLHCYQYGRPESKMLESICESVRYYKRKVFRNPIYNTKPYIVASRNSTAMIENLLAIDCPILFEGLHSTYYLDDPRLKKRYKIVRTHNIEHDYYMHLSEVESNPFKKYFFKIESERLRKHESVLKHADCIAAISPNDFKYFDKKYGNAMLLPPFHVNSEVTTEPGRGDFILYHGNLAVGENNEAAIYLLTNVLNKVDKPVVIAGNDPSAELQSVIASMSNVELRTDITSEEINHLIAEAQINILYTNQATGIKLKLLNSLFMGRHCIANEKMIADTGLEQLCTLCNTAKDYVEAIEKLWNDEVTDDVIDLRNRVLDTSFSNDSGVEQLYSKVYGERLEVKTRVEQE